MIKRGVMKKIIIEKSPYSLFLFFLIEEDDDNIIFILNGGIPYSIIKNIKKIYRSVYYIEKLNLKRDKSLKNYIRALKLILNYVFNICKLRKIKKFKLYIKPNLYLSWFFIFRNFYLLEEGKEVPNYLKNKRLINYFYRYLQKIYITENAKVEKKFSNKYKKIDILQLWNKKSEIEKLKIYEIFNFNYEKLNHLKNKDFLLLTQPLEEHGISELEKIEIYQSLLKNLDKEIERKLVIKMHPREKTDYYYYFPNALIIQGDIINEMFYVADLRFENVVTLFSTAASNIRCKKLYFFGTVNSKKLEKVFGKINSYTLEN